MKAQSHEKTKSKMQIRQSGLASDSPSATRMASSGAVPAAAAPGVRKVQSDHSATPPASTGLPPMRSAARASGPQRGGGLQLKTHNTHSHTNLSHTLDKNSISAKIRKCAPDNAPPSVCVSK